MTLEEFQLEVDNLDQFNLPLQDAIREKASDRRLSLGNLTKVNYYEYTAIGELE